MHNPVQRYDLAIIGGGLAGLALSIQAAKAGYRTILLEKESYPYHKVCGEYISMESWDFIERLGVDLKKMELPIIQRLQISAPDGTLLEEVLPLGGFGISRYTLDHRLVQLAREAGVELIENCKVTDCQFTNEHFRIEAGANSYESTVAVGSFGKRANLDIKWNRSFVQQKPNKLNNYIAVKYHIQIDFPDDMIALHNFENGYCGISKIEDDRYCLCYLTTAENLKKSNNSIPQMEQAILYRNPFLQKIFTGAQFLYEQPITISQISFDPKALVENHLLLVGDAGGMIPPLCGNGMSMALHGSKLAFQQIDAFLQKQISRTAMENQYQEAWNAQFQGRMRMGRIIQRFFGKSRVTNLFIRSFKLFPFLVKPLIKQTHGRTF